MHKHWTESEVETLESLIRLGLSYAQVGQALGRTKSAIKGKAFRVRLFKPTRKAPQAGEYPTEYYEGAAAASKADCPYATSEIGKRCWWLAGFNDGKRGAA